jgi:hypothetical protein
MNAPFLQHAVTPASAELSGAVAQRAGLRLDEQEHVVLVVLDDAPPEEVETPFEVAEYQVTWDGWDITVFAETPLDAARAARGMQERLGDTPAVFTVSGPLPGNDCPTARYRFALRTT